MVGVSAKDKEFLHMLVAQRRGLFFKIPMHGECRKGMEPVRRFVEPELRDRRSGFERLGRREWLV